MKKTLIALAALAAFGSASAEVTLYGKIDLGISNTTDNTKTSFGATTTANLDQGLEVKGNNYETSRFGIKGDTDLGGGIKGMFQLEQGFIAGDGSNKSSGSTFNRVSSLGLTGSFGTVSAGLQWSPYDSAWETDSLEFKGFSAMSSAFYQGVHGDNGSGGYGNVKNSIQYATPDMNGFSAAIMYSNDANKADAQAATQTTLATPANGGTSYYGIGLNYVKGPLTINFATEHVLTSAQFYSTSPYAKYYVNRTLSEPTIGASPRADATTEAWILAGSYKFAKFTLNASLEEAKADGFTGTTPKDSGYGFGISYPISSATTIAAGYAKEKTTADGVSVDGQAESFGAQVIYNWTQKMAAYGGVVTLKRNLLGQVDTLGKSYSDTSTTYAAGLRYNF